MIVLIALAAFLLVSLIGDEISWDDWIMEGE